MIKFNPFLKLKFTSKTWVNRTLILRPSLTKEWRWKDSRKLYKIKFSFIKNLSLKEKFSDIILQRLFPKIWSTPIKITKMKPMGSN